MEVPDALRTRILEADAAGPTVRFVFVEDRFARGWLWAWGTLSVLKLGAWWLWGGPSWRWVGVVAVPLAALGAVALASRLGRTTEVTVTGSTIQVGPHDVPLRDVVEVSTCHGGVRVAVHGARPVSLAMSGESTQVRQDFAVWLRQCAAHAAQGDASKRTSTV